MRKLLVIVLFLGSCAGETVPKGILPPQKMQTILYDVIRADELVDFSVLQDSTYRKLSKRTALYDSIFNIHKITKEEFRKSFQYYQNRPDMLRVMLDSLQNRATPVDTVRKTQELKPV